MSGDYYVIDSSSLIELNRRYPPDRFPSLWKKIESLIKEGLIIAPEEVRKEILRGDDTLKRWVIDQKKLFKPLSPAQMGIVKEILRKYPAIAKSDSETPVADPFVIALAVEMQKDPQTHLAPVRKGRIIVTEERLRGLKVKIPLVCQDYGINCIDLLGLCREEGWTF